MDRLRGAFHGVSIRLGRNEQAPTTAQTASTRNTGPAVSQSTPAKPLPDPPRPPQADPEAARGQVPYVRDSRLYLPSIQLRRRANQQTHQHGAKTVETHDYAAGAQQEKGTGSTSSTLWDKARSRLGLKQEEETTHLPGGDYDAEMVDALDTIDPEVQTLISLTNVQNSLFVPNLGKFVNRRPTFSITDLLKDVGQKLKGEKDDAKQAQQSLIQRPAPVHRADTSETINSRLSDSRYAVLPDNASLSGWTHEDRLELNDHVRHMLHSRRSKFARAMKGFVQYVSRPLGFCITLYATLITLFGLAWVLFLIGWINVGGKQLYVINVIDNVLVALFAVIGDGMAPFRAVDTYHMIFVARYHHLTWAIRRKRNMPDLEDHNDLPTEMPPPPKMIKPRRRIRALNKAASKLHMKRRFGSIKFLETPGEFSVLTHDQQRKLDYHASKFNKSHTFYKPHETETHYAFPLRLLIAIVVLLDCHSLLQISLGTVTWSINYKVRPFALTTVILICSITCNATAGFLIWIGDKKTRKKHVLERINRQELTQEAIDKMERRWREEESGPER